MSYIGSTPTTQSFIAGTDYFNGDGSTTAFTLSRSVVSTNDIQATVNNVVQQPNTAYTVSGTTITFTSAPSAGTANIYVRYLSTTTQSITPSQNTVSYSTLNSDNQSKLGISFKNRIINGNMIIWQRGTSFSAIGYTADRWSFYAGTSPVVTQSSDVPAGYRYSAALSGTGSTGFTQKIESNNVSDLSGQSVTISFWLKQTVGAGSSAIAISLSYATAQDNFGSTTSIGSTNITTTSSWAYYTATFNGLPSGVTNGLQCTIVTNSGSAVAFQLTGIQLEVGTQATTFDYRSYGTELALCQRYFIQTQSSAQSCALGAGTTSGAGGNGCLVYIPLSPSMRAVPTGTISGVGWTDNATYTATASSINSIAGSYNSIRLYLSGSGGSTTNGAAVLMVTTATSGGYLALSAEL